jgi:hypothetical protein
MDLAALAVPCGAAPHFNQVMVGFQKICAPQLKIEAIGGAEEWWWHQWWLVVGCWLNTGWWRW